MPDLKPFLSHAELVQHLIAQNLTVEDEPAAEQLLRKYGYHRLSGYRYPFREMLPVEQQNPKAKEYRSDRHVDGSRLDDVIRIAEFDAKLRHTCTSGLLDFEVRLRCAIAHTLAIRSPLAHLDTQHLDQATCDELASEGTKFDAWKRTYTKARDNNTTEDFVTHHLTKYSCDLPVWATVELLNFGSLPYLYGLMKPADQNAVSEQFGVRNGRSFKAWIWQFVDLRNHCAHGARLFNRSMKRKVSVKRVVGVGAELDHLIGYPERESDRLYPVVATLAYSLKSHESSSRWPLTLKTTIRKLPSIEIPTQDAPLFSAENDMGFPNGWDQLTLWS